MSLTDRSALPLNLFISYRRADAEWPADRLYRRLSEKLSANQIFLDRETINVGWDFRRDIVDWIEQSDAVLIMIGSQWTSLLSSDGRTPRLFLEDDTVRFEVESALEKEIPVVPILVGDTPMPDPESLPLSLQSITSRAGVQLRVTSFDADVELLLEKLELSLSRTRAAEPVITPTDTPLNHDDELVLRFLKRWPTWGFSVPRIKTFGGQHSEFGALKELNAQTLRASLDRLVASGHARTRPSKSGNTLYQAV